MKPWHQPAKQFVKTANRSLVKTGLYLRAIALRSPGGLVNLYHASVQKAGSQWIKAVLGDRRIVCYTRLLLYPQHRYEWSEFHRRFPRYTFVPGLYISYPSFEEIRKPSPWKAFYVTRDPRDIVVSWYYSMLETHAPMGRVPKHRMTLHRLSFEEGIAYCIRELSLKFQFMRTWAYANDTNIAMVRFEDLVQDPATTFGELLSFCGFSVPDFILRSVLMDYTKEHMRQRDLERRQAGSHSHYRRDSLGWREVLTEAHLKEFYSITGNLVELLGYPSK